MVSGELTLSLIYSKQVIFTQMLREVHSHVLSLLCFLLITKAVEISHGAATGGQAGGTHAKRGYPLGM